MKSLVNFIKEAYGDLDIYEISSIICDFAFKNLKNKMKNTSAEDIMKYADERNIAEELLADEDEVFDFINDNYDEILKTIDKLKNNY